MIVNLLCFSRLYSFQGTKLRNVLVIGDSVSIGYTPFVTAALQTEALVQHAPWGMSHQLQSTHQESSFFGCNKIVRWLQILLNYMRVGVQ